MGKVIDVLSLLEEMLDSGKSAEEVCRDCPEFLPEVRRRWKNFCRIDAEVEALLPDPATVEAGGGKTPTPNTELPRIPGYEVEVVIGRGGMGVVYKARQCALDRLVAIKMLLAGPLAGPQDLTRFRREIAALASLRHPNIVQVYDAGEVERRPYFAMEFVEGGSLARKLSGTPQPARQAAALLATLAETMQVAHESGIVHRDLKPANILLTAVGTPKITDFGLARTLEGTEDLTRTGVPLGTPSYMAPEQARGQTHAIKPAVDVYALGAVLYELLTGRPPFRGETPEETLRHVIQQEPVSPTRLNPKTPRDLETICLKCLHKSPSRRYASAAALAEDLHRYERGEPITARPVGRPERLARWVRRRPAAAGLIVMLSVLALVVGGAALLQYQQRVASQVHRAETDGNVAGVLTRAHALLDEGWAGNDFAKLTEARAEATRAADVASNGGASPSLLQEAREVQDDVAARLERAKRNRTLQEALLEILAPQERGYPAHVDIGMFSYASVDEQYAVAFRRWGLDVDATPPDKAVERLRQEPDVVLQELIAGLDAWMVVRRMHGRPRAECLHLYSIAA